MSFFRTYVRMILLQEAKIDDIFKKYPNVDQAIIVELNEADPSPTKKYLTWMVKQFVSGFKTVDIIPTVQFFHQNPNKFTKRDINQYRDAKELEDAVKETSSKVSSTEQRKQIKTSGGTKIYEDEIVTVVRIDSKAAAQLYGSGTKWCITMAGQNYYEQYTRSNVVFHFILRKKPKGDEFDKIAVATQRDAQNKIMIIEFFDAEDSSYPNHEIVERVPEINKFIGKIEADAKAQPKAFLAKLKSNEPVTDEEIKQYWMSLDSLPEKDKARAQQLFFISVPEKQQSKMMSYISDELRDIIQDGGIYDNSQKGFIFEDEDGELHRENGPAIIRNSGEKIWYRHGKKHREDGPAEINQHGEEYWWFEGKLHREDGPAIIYPSGTKEWFKHNKLHREDGPAIIGADGTKEWRINGKRHRIDGPAVIHSNGYREWWINNVEYFKEELKNVPGYVGTDQFE